MPRESLADCKPCRLRARPRLLTAIVFCLVAVGASPGQLAWAQHEDGAATKTAEESEPAVPELSLESLYHPKHKFSYFTPTPSTHWIDGASPKLLVRRGQQWNEVDLGTLEEHPWPVIDRMTEQLKQLDGLNEKEARSAALSAVTKMESADDTVLVRVKKSLAIVSPNQPARWLSRDAQAWRIATLDPTERRVAYTKGGDLYIVDVRSERSLQLTHDGTDTMLDGILDWTYQEEIFGRGNYRGFWFSPDGMWMAMLRIDISGIEPYVLSSAGSERGQGIVARYPKAGDPIPHAELYLWDLRGLDTGAVPPPKLLAKSTPQEPRIITGVWWSPHQTALLFAVSDRVQSWREIRGIDAAYFTGLQTEPSLFFREESPTWVEPPAAPGWMTDGSVLWRSELPSGRTRVYHISANGKVVTPITPPNFDVRDFHVKGERLIVTGDALTGTTERHAYRVDVRPDASYEMVPITSDAGWHSIQPSPDLRWFIDRYSTATNPTEVWLRSVEGNNSRQLAKSESKLSRELIPPKVFTIETEDGVSLPAMLIRPPSATEQEPCPVVIEVYGGPGAPVVSTRFAGTKTLYRELLARDGIATLLVDNRSSAGAGLADTWQIHRRVGEQEFGDVMSAVAWLRGQKWVNAEKIAIRGWSFGGFLTLYAMTHSDAFAAGIAGGSVTDWKEYDAFYTERYMGLPSENPDGYRDTAPVTHANKLQGRVLLIHGESDDNVHPSNTMRMAAALQRAGIDFDLMIYPAAAHGIHDPRQVWHLHQMTDRFLREQLLEP